MDRDKLTNRLREYAPEELLGRASAPMDMVGAEELVAGRRVLVTGAAGSVGTPLVRMLAGMDPAELLLLDHHEHTLFRLRGDGGNHETHERHEAGDGGTRGEREGEGEGGRERGRERGRDAGTGGTTKHTRDTKQGTGGRGEGVAVRLWLADVRDRSKLQRLFRSARPDVVFHLAAYKHVPLGEENPDQTVAVNLAGTRALIETSAEFEVPRFVYPSSDKAVNPPSVYGCTKKVAEELTLAAAREMGIGASVVRFVNIVGTRGSVIETLTAQVAGGRPITITDAGMTRYWITMAEATRLLAQTAAAPTSGIVHLPETGPAINLAEMARRLCYLLTGESDYPLQIIGSRPGERMHEILLSDSETAVRTDYPGILRVETSRRVRPSYDALSAEIDWLMELAEAGEYGALRGRLMELATSLQ